MLNNEFGEGLVNETRGELETYFNKTVTTVKQYFSLVDARVAEFYQTEREGIRAL